MKRLWYSIGVAVLVIVLIVTFFQVRYPSDPLVVCHKGFDSAIEQWIMENHTNVYPNIDGNCRKSFESIAVYVAPQRAGILDRYMYIPGLTHDDPSDLVLIYLKEKTRRKWHGDHTKSVFTKPQWMVLTPDIQWPNDYPEPGLLLDTPEFKKRLQSTLDFLKTNNRPHWEIVAKEHMEFLNSIRE